MGAEASCCQPPAAETEEPEVPSGCAAAPLVEPATLLNRPHALPDEDLMGHGIAAPEKACGATLQQAAEAASLGRLFWAQSVVEQARLQGGKLGADLPLAEYPVLQGLKERVACVRRVLEACSPPSTAEWKHLDLEACRFWRRWDAEGKTLHAVSAWEAVGSLEQQIASMRDADVAEELWDGACWDMTCQQGDGATLVRWLQKEPLTGNKVEVILERTLCDCLDGDRPCWVLVERTPQIPDFENFSGRWGAFTIPAKPAGYTRPVTPECGRILEPIGPDRVRVTMAFTVQFPAVIWWLLSDRILTLGVSFASTSAMKSWEKIIGGWAKSGYPKRIQRDSDFYGPLEDRIAAFFAESRAGGA